MAAFVQQAIGGKNSSGTTYTITLSSPPSSGNVLFFWGAAGAGTVPTITPSGAGATWTELRNVLRTGASRTVLWIGTNPSSTVITVTMSAAGRAAGHVSEWSGLSTTQDGINSASGFSASPACGNITTANANDLILIGFGHGLDTTTVSGNPPTGYTALTVSDNPDGNIHVIPAYQIVSATATYSGSWGLSASSDWEAIVVAYQSSAGAFTLVADPATFAITAAALTPLADRFINAAPAVYTLSPADGSLIHGFALNLEPATFALTPADGTLLAARLLVALPAQYDLTAANASLLRTLIFILDPATYTIVAAPAGVLAGRLLTASPAAYTIAAFDATLIYTQAGAFVLIADPATFTITPAGAIGAFTRVLSADPAAFIIMAMDATLTIPSPIPPPLESIADFLPEELKRKSRKHPIPQVEATDQRFPTLKRVATNYAAWLEVLDRMKRK